MIYFVWMKITMMSLKVVFILYKKGYSVKVAVHLAEKAWSLDFTIVRCTIYENLMLLFSFKRYISSEYHFYQ